MLFTCTVTCSIHALTEASTFHGRRFFDAQLVTGGLRRQVVVPREDCAEGDVGQRQLLRHLKHEACLRELVRLDSEKQEIG